MKRKVEIGFSLMIVLVFAFALFEARGWQIYARLLPWVVGLPMLALALCQLALDIRHGGTKVNHITPSGAACEIAAPVVQSRTISILAWLLGLFLAIWLLGFSISIPLFTLLYLKIESQESWWLAIFLSAVAWGFFFGFFKWAVNLPFPEGQLFSWLAFRT
jgi:hypothetical protein